MRTGSILLAAGILTISLAPIISEQSSASAQIYDFTTIAGSAGGVGSDDGTNSDAQFNNPVGVAVDINGNLYVGDYGNYTIRKITPVGGTNWVTTTIGGLAGNFGDDDGTNKTARFSSPHGVAVDTNGNVYVADSGNYTIRKITPVEGTTNWVTTTIAGLAGNLGGGDGTNSDARFNYPTGIAVDDNGNVYVADSDNDTIRKITPVGTGGTNWVTTTIAGSDGSDGSADGTNSVARFSYPAGIAVDTNGNLYVADMNNDTIRKITPVGGGNWVTTTIGGVAGVPGFEDGTNSAAWFDSPWGIAVGTNGNLYVADTDNSIIRKMTPVVGTTNWVTTTIGGVVGVLGDADGAKRNALFSMPWGVAVDGSGNVYVADTENNTIRQGVPWDMLLTITKATATVNFNRAKSNIDSCALTATLNLGASYNLTNKVVSLDIGGADVSFNLDATGKGHGTNTYGSCTLSHKKKTGPWTFTTTLKHGSWATPWAAYGLTNATIKAGVRVTLPATLVIDDELFYGEKTLLYKAKLNKSGTAK
jgi:hypothetical protein